MYGNLIVVVDESATTRPKRLASTQKSSQKTRISVTQLSSDSDREMPSSMDESSTTRPKRLASTQKSSQKTRISVTQLSSDSDREMPSSSDSDASKSETHSTSDSDTEMPSVSHSDAEIPDTNTKKKLPSPHQQKKKKKPAMKPKRVTKKQLALDEIELQRDLSSFDNVWGSTNRNGLRIWILFLKY